MQHQIVTTSPARPSRAQIEPAALELLSRHSAGLLATARRYSSTPEDAEDAYQRGLEILLTKAPTTSEDELVPWLKTVVIRTLGPVVPRFLGWVQVLRLWICFERPNRCPNWP